MRPCNLNQRELPTTEPNGAVASGAAVIKLMASHARFLANPASAESTTINNSWVEHFEVVPHSGLTVMSEMRFVLRHSDEADRPRNSTSSTAPVVLTGRENGVHFTAPVRHVGAVNWF